MAVVRTYGEPRLFVTFTRNPSWPEIVGYMLPKQHARMRPDVAARVFRIKLAGRTKDICASGVFGRTVARSYFIEFRKRGLPNAHILCILAGGDSPRTTGDYDIIVSAVIPGPGKEHVPWHAVATTMTHGQCGAINPKSPAGKEENAQRGTPNASEGIQ